MAASESGTHVSLSDREMQIIDLVATGLTNQEIAAKLEISKRTVDNHISNILTKTKTDNRVALVRWALQWGKVCLNDVNCCPLPIWNDESKQGLLIAQLGLSHIKLKPFINKGLTDFYHKKLQGFG